MPQTIRFHLDEHCPKALAEGLRRRGIDVTTTSEAGLRHASDEEHLAFAVRQGLVVFTQDEDFLRLHAAGLRHAGPAYCHQDARTLGDIIRGLVLIWNIYEPEGCLNYARTNVVAHAMLSLLSYGKDGDNEETNRAGTNQARRCRL